MNYLNAGREFPVCQLPMPAASEPETLMLCSGEAAEVLRRILYERQDDLLAVFLQQLVSAQQRIREDLIPELLDKGKESLS
jgi:hypothetical protein